MRKQVVRFQRLRPGEQPQRAVKIAITVLRFSRGHATQRELRTVVGEHAQAVYRIRAEARAQMLDDAPAVFRGWALVRKQRPVV